MDPSAGDGCGIYRLTLVSPRHSLRGGSSLTCPKRSQETLVDDRMSTQLEQEGSVAEPTCSFRRKGARGILGL